MKTNPFVPMQSGVCGCERGYTEVMTAHGFLDYCTRNPGVDNSKKADVKTNTGRLKPGPSQAQDVFNEWTLQPLGPGTVCPINHRDDQGLFIGLIVIHWNYRSNVFSCLFQVIGPNSILYSMQPSIQPSSSALFGAGAGPPAK